MAQKWEYFGNISEFVSEFVLSFFFRMKVSPAFRRPLLTTITIETPPKRKMGTEVSLGHRYGMAVGTALTIPPGNSRVPKGILGPLTERYGVGSDYLRKRWAEWAESKLRSTSWWRLSWSSKRSTTVPRWNGFDKASSRFTTKHSVN